MALVTVGGHDYELTDLFCGRRPLLCNIKMCLLSNKLECAGTPTLVICYIDVII